MNHPDTVASLLAICLAAPVCGAPQPGGGLGGGGALEVHRCIAPHQEIAIRARNQTYLRQVGSWSAPQGQRLFPLYPAAGVPGVDLAALHYVDLAPGPGVRDWKCSTVTYDGHDASDVVIRGFAEQDVGVPIFAPLDGRVIWVEDNWPDRNVSSRQSNVNYLSVDVGNGRICSFAHLKRGSARVAVNEWVRTGQELAEVGSSGPSTWPHLHFSTYDDNSVVEPFAGACAAAPSGFVDQPRFPGEHWLLDVGITNVDLSTLPPMPEPMARGGQVALADPLVYVWIVHMNLPANADFSFRFLRPDGSVGYDSGTRPLNNPIGFRLAWNWFHWNVPDMHRITGPWRMELSMNGRLLADVPCEVRATSADFRNRPPAAVDARLAPAAPGESDPIVCTVLTPAVDDVDYDLVRYRYSWEVSGRRVRSAVHAGQTDVLPQGAALGGDLVTCDVTPCDGVSDGPTTRRQARVEPSPWRQAGAGKPGSGGSVPSLTAFGALRPGSPGIFFVDRGRPGARGAVFLSDRRGDLPWSGGVLVPVPVLAEMPILLDGAGHGGARFEWPAGVRAGGSVFAQAWLNDPGASFAVSASNGLQGTTPR